MTIDGIKNHDLWAHPDDEARLRRAEQEILTAGALAELDAWLTKNLPSESAPKPPALPASERLCARQVDVWAAA